MPRKDAGRSVVAIGEALCRRHEAPVASRRPLNIITLRHSSPHHFAEWTAEYLCSRPLLLATPHSHKVTILIIIICILFSFLWTLLWSPKRRIVVSTYLPVRTISDCLEPINKVGKKPASAKHLIGSMCGRENRGRSSGDWWGVDGVAQARHCALFYDDTFASISARSGNEAQILNHNLCTNYPDISKLGVCERGRGLGRVSFNIMKYEGILIKATFWEWILVYVK